MNISDIVPSLIALIGELVEANQWIGCFGIFFAMFLENLFPPIPSELIMPLAGFYVSQGQLSFLPVVIAGVLGTVLGAFPWYGLGRLFNEQRIEFLINRYGKWIGIKHKNFTQTRTWFDRYGTSLVFWGRLVPGIRTLISVPAGIELMPLLPFIFWTTLGSLIWTCILTISGIMLGESYNRVELLIEPFSRLIKGILVVALFSFAIWILIRFLTRNKIR